MPSPFPCSLVIHQSSWKKTYIKKNKQGKLKNEKEVIFEVTPVVGNSYFSLSNISRDFLGIPLTTQQVAAC